MFPLKRDLQLYFHFTGEEPEYWVQCSIYIGFKQEGKVTEEGREDESTAGSPRVILHLFSCRERSENYRGRMTLVLATAFIP